MTPFSNRYPPARLRPSYGGILLLGLTLVIVIACAVSLFASPRLQSLLLGTPPTPSPTVPLATLPSVDLQHSALSDLAMVSSDDGWIVGKNSGYALILRYQAGRWLPQPVTVVHGWLQAVAFASAQDGWAVGSQPLDGSPPTNIPSSDAPLTEALVLHYQHGHWSRLMPSTAITGTLTKIRLASADDWWALNNRGEAFSPALVHYRRGVWSVLPLPADLSDVHGLWVAGPDDMWLATIGGVTHIHNGIIERSLQGIRGNLLALDLHAPQNGWAVGLTFCSTAPGSTVCDDRVAIYHYDGAAWTPSATDARGMLNAVASVSANDVWASGYGMMTKAGPSSLILHYHNGQWQQYSADFAIGLNALSMTSATEGWAVGYAQLADGTGIAPGLLHYHDGTWTQVTLA